MVMLEIFNEDDLLKITSHKIHGVSMLSSDWLMAVSANHKQTYTDIAKMIIGVDN